MELIELDNLPLRAPTKSGLAVPNWVPAPLRWRLVWWHQHLRVGFEALRRPIVTLGGVKVQASRELSDNIRAAIFDGYYESEEIRSVYTKLVSHDRVMEIGAGIGLISAYCARRIGSDRVFSYEANPALERNIRRTYELNGVSPVLNICAIGPAEGETDFYVSNDFWSS